MKVTAFNGSPRKKWNTAILLEKALEGAASQEAETTLPRGRPGQKAPRTRRTQRKIFSHRFTRTNTDKERIHLRKSRITGRV